MGKNRRAALKPLGRPPMGCQMYPPPDLGADMTIWGCYPPPASRSRSPHLVSICMAGSCPFGDAFPNPTSSGRGRGPETCRKLCVF